MPRPLALAVLRAGLSPTKHARQLATARIRTATNCRRRQNLHHHHRRKPMRNDRRPAALAGTIFAKARPNALPIPADKRVLAEATPRILDRWASDAAGIRAVESGDNVITMFDV